MPVRRVEPAPEQRADKGRVSMGIVEERGKSYGNGDTNLNRIAALWSAYTGIELTAHDVCWMMVLLKSSRSRQDPANADNYIDGHGYLQLAERLQP